MILLLVVDQQASREMWLSVCVVCLVVCVVSNYFIKPSLYLFLKKMMIRAKVTSYERLINLAWERADIIMYSQPVSDCELYPQFKKQMSFYILAKLLNPG